VFQHRSPSDPPPPSIVIDWGNHRPAAESPGRAPSRLRSLFAGIGKLWRKWMNPPRPRRSRRHRGLGGEACESRTTLSAFAGPAALGMAMAMAIRLEIPATTNVRPPGREERIQGHDHT
jgi:hypothetical protein